MAKWKYKTFRGGRSRSRMGPLTVLALCGIALAISPTARRVMKRVILSGRWAYVNNKLETSGVTMTALALNVMRRVAEQGAVGARNIVEQFREATADLAAMWNRQIATQPSEGEKKD